MKKEISTRALMGIGGAVVIVVAGLLVYFFRASDPAARPPIPYKKFDYGSHMQQMGQTERQMPSAPGTLPSGSQLATP